MITSQNVENALRSLRIFRKRVKELMVARDYQELKHQVSNLALFLGSSPEIALQINDDNFLDFCSFFSGVRSLDRRLSKENPNEKGLQDSYESLERGLPGVIRSLERMDLYAERRITPREESLRVVGASY